MSRILTPFERHLKEQISDYEMPYDPHSWSDLQKKMGNQKSGKYVVIVALAATVAVSAGGFFAWHRIQNAPASAQAAFAETRFNNPVVMNGISGKTYTSASDNNQTAENQSLTPNYNNIHNNNTGASTQSGHAGGLNPNQQLHPGNTGNNSGSNLADGESGVNSTPDIVIPKGVVVDNVISLVSNVRQACEGTEVEFTATNAPTNADYGYLWNFGDGHFSTSPKPKHKFAKAGNYDVSLSVTSKNGKINTTVMNDMITINPAPDADFRWEFVNEDPMKPEVKVVNTSEDAVSYEWTTNSGTSKDATAPSIPVGKDKQLIALSVRNDYGCEDGAVKHVTINTDFSLDAPEKYTVGRGTFMPQGLKQSKANFVMSIYTMDNNKVFETSNRLKGWDGSLPGGTKASAGQQFKWKVIITNDITKEQKYFNGILTVSP
ncbi:MAG: PKD domain-containing protein [Flavobacteriales bacterium]|nr:PKD domain-containing protein [Flavobacteriales bacterium]